MTDLVLDVERLTYGFDALARHDGQVVFVPYTAPGDRVAAHVVGRKPGYLRAALDAVLVPGSARVTPACAAFGTCGGCQWQHVAVAAQREAKAALVREQLARIAGQADVGVLPLLHTDAAFGYRGRIALVVEGRQLGYHRRGSHVLVEVDACPIAAPDVSAHLPHARAWIASLRAAVTRATIAAAPGGVVLVAETTTAPGAADVDASAAACARDASVRGVVLAGGGRRHVVGDPTIRVEVEPDCALEVPADVFTQVNPAANQLLVATVIAWVAPAPGRRVFDGYCGAGNFTLPLARRGAHVTGVERAAVAGAAARANAARLGLDDVVIHDRDTAAGARALAADGVRFDTVVIDPPRAGATGAVEALAAFGAERVVYVSCDPATLARDVARFATHGYRLARVQPIDLFPQTFHVETVAELLLT